MTDPTLPVAPVQPETPAVAAGWYPDASTGQQRWWDGTQWTEHVAPPAAPAASAAPQQMFVTYQKNSTNGVALAAVILGAAGTALSLIPILGVFLCWAPALLGIIFGFVGLSNAKKLNGLRKTAALWGVILGFAPIPITIIWIVVGLAGVAASGHYSTITN